LIFPFAYLLYGCSSSGGCFQVPSSTSGFGQYRRITIRNGPFGAGSQFDSLSSASFFEFRVVAIDEIGIKNSIAIDEWKTVDIGFLRDGPRFVRPYLQLTPWLHGVIPCP